jgi:hypothetical protein
MGYTLHATKKLLQRLKAPIIPAPSPSTRLTNWYANILFWKPHVVLFTNEATLLPVLVPYAPSATLLARFPLELERVLLAHNILQHIVSTEIAHMAEVNLAPTANRRVMGHLNEFAWQAEGYKINSTSLLQVSLKLADTPCNYLKDLGYNPSEAVKTLLLNSLN